MQNILVTSAGRRVGLIQAFKTELSGFLPSCRLYAIDFNPELSSACQVADFSHPCPRVTSPGYVDYLLYYCLKYQIGLVIPTIDTELAILANNKDLFSSNGITICISDKTLIDNCRDKRDTGVVFQQYGIPYPEIYNREDLRFPCFAKPYNGSCSIGAMIIKNQEAMNNEILGDPDMMFMELIDKSYSEYTVDAYYDKHSNLKCLVPRKRLEVRSGEVSKGITIKNFLYQDLVNKINHMDCARGCITLQFFVSEETGHYIGLEINPRFGGGYPLSYAAGANYPAFIIQEYLLDKPIGFNDCWEENLLMLRYDAQVLVHDVQT